MSSHNSKNPKGYKKEIAAAIVGLLGAITALIMAIVANL